MMPSQTVNDLRKIEFLLKKKDELRTDMPIGSDIFPSENGNPSHRL